MGDVAQALAAAAAIEPARAIALRLHGLHEEDRVWILAQLDPAARSTLTALLEELATLGFAAAPELRNFATLAPVTVPADMPEPLTAAEAAVDEADVMAIRQLLSDEPAAVRHCLLGMRRWQWLESAAFGPESERAARLPTPNVRQAVVQALADRIAATPTNVARGDVSSSVGIAPVASGGQPLLSRLKAVWPWRS